MGFLEEEIPSDRGGIWRRKQIHPYRKVWKGRKNERGENEH